MMPALHQQARSADRERLLDLLVDDGLRQEVALTPVSGPAVEGAEIAVRHADVRVVQVPVDDERHPARVVQPVSDGVRNAPDRDEIARAKEGDCILLGDALSVEGLVEHLANGRLRCDDAHTRASAGTKRSSGTCSSSPASLAISRKV